MALTVFALMFIAIGLWSFASPLVAAPDEQAHIIRAVALDHGQLGSQTYKHNKVDVTVVIPESIYFTNIYPVCWQFKGTVPATCSPAWNTSSKTLPAITYVGHYPPLYYLLVGTGSYVSEEKSGIYLMRLISAALSAFMFAMCAYTVVRWSRRRTMAVGVFLAFTPLAFFLSSSVNPSGFEIATAICLWSAAVIFGLDYADDPPHGLIVVIGIAASVLILIRGLSPLWVALVALTILSLVGPRRLLVLIRQRRDVQLALGAICVAGVLAAMWIFTQGTLNILPVGAPVPKSDSELQVVNIVFHQTWRWIREDIGVLGWLDTPFPATLYLAWKLLVGALVVIGLVRSTWRQRIVLLAICFLAVAIPVVLVSHQARVLGVVWQGRDGMPLTVGGIILAASLCAKAGRATTLERGVSIGVVAIISLLDMVAFYTNMRRYAVGVHSDHWFFLHNIGWSPPTGQFLTLALYGIVTVVIAVLVALWLWFADDPVEIGPMVRRRAQHAIK